MMNRNDYMVAKCHICIEGPWADLSALGLPSFEPFALANKPTTEPALTVITGCDAESLLTEGKLLTSFDFEGSIAVCHFIAQQDGWCLKMEGEGYEPLIFVYNNSSDTARSNAGTSKERMHQHLFRFGMWFMCNIAMVKRGITAIHSSVIVHNQQAILFLGESGTGKSTHTRLWRENIDEATLLNDDSPFLALEGDTLYAYGSPWSGKTPCYKNEHYPVKAIVRLSQAPYNAMRPLSSLRAMGALMPSLSPAFMFDSYLENKVMETAGAILSHTKFFHLECLPDRDAALLSCNTIFRA